MQASDNFFTSLTMSQILEKNRFYFSFILVEEVIDGAQHSILVHGVSISFVKKWELGVRVWRLKRDSAWSPSTV